MSSGVISDTTAGISPLSTRTAVAERTNSAEAVPGSTAPGAGASPFRAMGISVSGPPGTIEGF
jgi:hypothetical protein